MYSSRTDDQFYKTAGRGEIMAVSISESQRGCDFKELLLEAVDASLSSLGDFSKQAIYFYLEKNFTLRKQDIPNKIEEFTSAIEEMFELGAKILEIEIMKHLYVKVGSDFEYFPENDALLFVEYIGAARMHVLRK